MEEMTRTDRVLDGCKRAVGLGLIAGGAETLSWGLHSPLGLHGTQAWVHGLANVLFMGLVAPLVALAFGALHGILKEQPGYRVVALQMGLTAGALLGFYLWPASWRIFQEGRMSAIALALLPFMGVVVVWLNARAWLARSILGRSTAPWLPVSVGVALLLMVVGVGLGVGRNRGGTHALESDPSIVLVTVDGLKGEPSVLSSWAGQGAAHFPQMVQPHQMTGPSLSALLSGLNPIRTGYIDEEHTLRRAFPVIAERFEEEGYATGAFVSTIDAARWTGLHQGMLTVDDALGSTFKAFSDIALFDRWIAPSTQPARRSDVVTAGEAISFWERHEGQPVLLWVHLAGDRHVDADVFAAIDDLLQALQDDDRYDSALIAVMGVGGTPRPREPFKDDTLVRPLWLRAPGHSQAGLTVDAQVRLVDVPQTILAFTGLGQESALDGSSLLGHAAGKASGSMWSVSLVEGRDGAMAVAMRNNGVKVVQDLQDEDDVSLYVIADDPDEEHDVADKQAEAASNGAYMMHKDAAAARGWQERRRPTNAPVGRRMAELGY